MYSGWATRSNSAFVKAYNDVEERYFAMNPVRTHLRCGVDCGEINDENTIRQVLYVTIVLLGILQEPGDKIVLRND